MFKQFVLLAVACGVTATAAKKLAARRQLRLRKRDTHAVQRWEDEGGAVVQPATAATGSAAANADR
jgi:hypothetical protein